MQKKPKTNKTKTSKTVSKKALANKKVFGGGSWADWRDYAQNPHRSGC
jgi:hypothetical protein